MDISAYQHMNIRMSTRGKRPLRNLTPSDKVRAIQRIHNGETKASVSRDIGVPESTLRGWCKNEQKLRFMCRQLGTDQIPMSLLENPPEKRTKTDPKHANIVSYEDIAYNRLSINGMDYVSKGSTGRNAIFEKIAFNEFMKKNSAQAEAASKQFGGNAPPHLQAGSSLLPVPVVDYLQLPMVQNLNLLSLLNPSLAVMPDFGAGSSLTANKVKVPLRTSNSANEAAAKDKTQHQQQQQQQQSAGALALSVKNWAKDPSENMSLNNHSASDSNNNNNNNNNEISSKQPLVPLGLPEFGAFPSLILPSGFPQVPDAGTDAESNNAALLEWCKMFNASLNFLAFAAAAAALQPSSLPATTQVGGTDEHSIKLEPTFATENILYKQLTKTSRHFHAPLTNFTAYMHSDVSNDSYLDSEPEDLSVRSNASKVSSLANSRSQSPAKSSASSSTAHSDAEQ